ncbi:MAG: nucleotidyltransferase domain-containing protein [Tissierellales bacterium]|nr:nucleotidyltransferase domain-containing protein [Tissierellales bacterium]
MTDTDKAIAKKFKNLLLKHVSLIDVRVFGSRARGDAEPDSDMDIFIEVDTTSPQIRELVEETAWEVGIGHLMHISPLLFSKYDIEQSPLRYSPIVQNIIREGVSV